jgi:hypothetical protein
MTTQAKQAQEFRDSPIWSRLTDVMRTLVRDSVADPDLRLAMISHINDVMWGRTPEPTALRFMERARSYSDQATRGVIRAVMDYCKEIGGESTGVGEVARS